MIHFDIDERYQDELVVGSAISRREGVIFSVLVHVLVGTLLMFLPGLSMFGPSAEELEAQQALLSEQELEESARRLVFVQPRVDLEAPAPPPRAELSDLDRRSQAPEQAQVPANPLPFSLGNSAERNEPAPAEERARGEEVAEAPQPEPEATLAEVRPPEQRLPPADTGLQPAPTLERPLAQGSLGDALRNLQQYVQNETFHNPQGGATDPGSTIQFDTKGVEFGPWLRRFVSQVRRSWFIPHAAMSFRGRVVLQFNIHKNGRITDLVIAQPSEIDAFNRAAYNAILGSNPTEPLPPEYPEPMAFFTVVFYYNEQPPLP